MTHHPTYYRRKATPLLTATQQAKVFLFLAVMFMAAIALLNMQQGSF